MYIYILLLASIIIPKECFSLCAQQKEKQKKQIKDNKKATKTTNKVTKTFQKKISIINIPYRYSAVAWQVMEQVWVLAIKKVGIVLRDRDRFYIVIWS